MQKFRIDIPLTHEHQHAAPGRLPAHPTLTSLHGELLLPDAAHGLVVLAAASDSGTLARDGDWHGKMLESGLGTLEIDLLGHDAARFADAAMHVPLLTEHLLAVLSQIARQMESEAIPALPVGLFAAGNATPVAIRAAAIRDTSIAALACAGGLVDLAGLQYLRELKAPLLMFIARDDASAFANLARARVHMPGTIQVELLPEAEALRAPVVASFAADWFGRHLGLAPIR